MQHSTALNRPGQRMLCLCAGSAVEEQGLLLKRIFERPQFRINVVPDADTVELCGALKASINIDLTKWIQL